MRSPEPAAAGLRAVEPFARDGFSGELNTACRPRDLSAALALVTDPAQSRETLHWGRNYLYSTVLETAAGDVEVVVKQFRNRRRRGGSKAWRSWRGALALAAAGVPTPAPVLWIESDGPGGPSFYVCRRVTGHFEARYLLRALNAGRHGEEFPDVDVELFFARLGGLLRRMHDAGIWHRDVSIGNILVVTGGEPGLYLIDLNRARLGQRLGTLRRSRDLCRLRLLRPRDRRRLLAGYWGPQARGLPWKRLLYAGLFRGFLLKNWLKAALRRPLRMGRGLRPARQPHAHIPAAASAAGVRDRVVWDRLSDQPHQHAGRLERLGVRLADAGDHGRSLAAAAGAAPRIWRRYRALLAGLGAAPVTWQGMGVALRPLAGDPEGEAAAGELAALGVRRVMLRLHPWQDGHAAEEVLARRLFEAGFELSFALPQSRELVRDPQRWRAAMAELAARFRPWGSRFQVGQAVNRSKWGIWRYGDYLELAAAACAELRRYPGTEVLGPAVIDFEPHATAAILNRRHPGIRFDAVSSLLYVDRRGAPENRQLGLDLVGKLVLLAAVAATGRNAVGGRSWVTEFNWPLWEGPHSPAGRDVAVDEDTQADYLARYYLLALGTGLVERVYWWQLEARGYGLVDPRDGERRRRPAFRALATLARELEGSDFLGPLPAPPAARLYRFARQDGEVVAGWSAGAPLAATLPRPAVAALSRDGAPLAVAGREIRLTGSPCYFRLAAGPGNGPS